MLTADTYVTVLRELGLADAERVAQLILSHGIKVPGTNQARRAIRPIAVIRTPRQALAA